MPLFKTPAIIIRSIDFSESDKIITFFTQQFGKVKGIAKGAKRSKKRFSGTLEIFSLVNLLFFEKSNFDLVRIEQCDLRKPFPLIRLDIEKVGYASYFMELVDKVVGEKEASRLLFELLVRLLDNINSEHFSEEVVRIFEIRLLSILGYQPNLSCCTICHKIFPRDEKVWFSPSRGGAICQTCSPNIKDISSVSKGTIKMLIRAREISFDKINRLNFSNQALEESKEMLSKFIGLYLGKELKSLKFLEKIRRNNFEL